MKKLILLSMAMLATAEFASAQSTEHDNFSASLKQTWNLGDSYEWTGDDDANAYANITTFSGTVSLNGGASNGITRLQADDIRFGAWSVGQQINKITFSVGNLNSVAVSARARLRFYLDSGTGTPGTLITGFSFNPISFAAGSANLFNFNPGAGFNVPVGAKLWAGMTFDNVGTSTTDAQLNNLGQLLFNAPTSGSSADFMFGTTVAGSFLADNPVGSSFNFGGNPVANVGWAFEAVPEPGTFAALAFGAAILLRRRRK